MKANCLGDDFMDCVKRIAIFPFFTSACICN